MSKDAPKAEGFFGRWSRLKTDVREAPAEPPAGAPLVALEPKAEDQPPELPAVDTLTIDSDFTGFLHPKVSEDVRRSALRKLFSDPHFNVMDGLDVYIDDYSVSEPIPAAMLASMKQAQRIMRWAEGHEDEEEATPEAEEAEAAAATSTEDAPAAIESAASDNRTTDPEPIAEAVPPDVVKPA